MRIALTYRHYLLMVLLLIPGAIIHGTLAVYAGETRDVDPPVSWNEEKGLQYVSDELGNRIPDFSCCGYAASETDIPDVPIRIVLPVIKGDATSLLQSAIDYLSTFPLDENGFRGTILLRKGIYRLAGRIKISASGIVIRGSGMNENGTVLLADGKDRMTLVRIGGTDDRRYVRRYYISGTYVPVNASEFQIDGNHSLKAGDRVFIHRPSTQKWIDVLSMKSFGGETDWLGWKPGERDIFWDRTVTGVNGNNISFDVPLTAALDSAYGGGTLISYTWPGRIRNIGIENLKLVSSYDTTNLKDESHCWMAITMENVEDAWVRQVEFSHFAGSAVAVYETARRITVQDCISLSPVSEIGGQRRYTFFTMGQQCLFQRLYAEHGCHDFSAGFCAAGPNAFIECQSYLPHNFSGAIDSWASGLLFDIVRVEGQAISLMNRGQDAMGSGWCAANSMLWQCSAARIDCYKPPTAYNWAFGCWSQFAGDGLWAESNNHIRPRSLYYAQLEERLKRPSSEFAGQIRPFQYLSSTSPTPELASELNVLAYSPALTLEQWIRDAPARDPIPTSETGVEVFDPKSQERMDSPVSTDQTHHSDLTAPDKTTAESPAGILPIVIQNGWLARDRKLLTGARHTVPWWRGDARPYESVKARPAITRFVPGRYGQGNTDRIPAVVEWMEFNHIIALEHNYGLWYDRRRDDHERIRRMDGEVWAPFYEQPFARSGEGIAWDGLSKYDLTRYNNWYWERLREFANVGESHGLLLLHHHYFQHNILEAGAHYADFPWRTANNINSTGFPEPPDYAGDKRIFMDGQFYDTLHPARRELHRNYIRKCLDNFSGNSNVIHIISAEYTGPLHFMQFWLDVIREWQVETGRDALVGLSATKDVQDAILRDPERAGIVDIIDLRYWAYREDGSLYAPAGGQHMAPRQHARKIPPGKRSFNQVYRAVSEYRNAYPDKTVICSERESARYGWAVFMAGGSLPELPGDLPEGFLSDAATMQPVKHPGNQGPDRFPDPELRNERGEAIIYVASEGSIKLDLTGYDGMAEVCWIDPVTGRVEDRHSISFGSVVEIEKPGTGPLVLWLSIK